MKFTKMQGAGNDYIYVNGFENDIKDPSSLAFKLSDRHFGIGGDGIVLILPSEVADFRMRMFNADGSEGKMCGNASRCIGKYVYDKGMTDKTELTLETLSGIKTLLLDVKDGTVKSVTVNMGKADFSPNAIPLISGKPVIGGGLVIGGETKTVTCVSMGNPHCVVFCDEPDDIDIAVTGRIFENADVFPERVNTEFVKVIDAHHLKMRVWERGSGETLACGTGACASVASAVANGICKAGEWTEVALRGGVLNIKYTDSGVFMRGEAEFVFEGEVNI